MSRILRIGTEAEREKEAILANAGRAIEDANILGAYWRAVCVALMKRMGVSNITLSADEVGPEHGTIKQTDLPPAEESNGDGVGRVLLEVVGQEECDGSS